MTTPTPGPPPWRPDQQAAWQPGPPQPAPSAAAPRPVRPLGGSFRGLAALTQVMLGVIVLLGGYVIALSLRGLQLVDALSSGTVSGADGEALDAQIRSASILYTVVFLICAGCFMAWSHTLRRSDRVAPEAMRFVPGWTIGGWFVPVLNFFRPMQTMTDLWRGLARPAVPHQAPVQPPVPGLIRAWWIAFLTMSIVGRLLIASVQNLPATLETARRAFTTEIVVDVLNIVAAVLAILMVRLVTARALRTPPAPAPGQPWQGPAAFPYPAGPQAPWQAGAPSYPPQPGPQQWTPPQQQWPPSAPPQQYARRPRAFRAACAVVRARLTSDP